VSEQNTADLLEIEKRSLDLRQSELKRKKDLFAQGTVAQSALESEQREFLAQTKKVQDIQNTLRLLPTQRAVLREQIAVDQAKLASARLDLKRTRITLPFDARIGSVDVEQAQYVQTNSKLVAGDSVDVAEVEAQVPISQFRAMVRASVPPDMKTGITAQSLARVVKDIGFTAAVRLRSGDEVIEWPARFARISDQVDPKTRTIGVIVAVDEPYAKAEPGVRPPLSKGMFVEIEVRTKPRAGAIAVPRAAVRNGRLYVVTGDSRLDIRTVKTGLVQGDITVISDGLKAGEQVVVSDLIPAVQGMLLDVRPDHEMQARINAEATGTAQP
jgi:RND family efflux transporter MFP subunit